MSACTILYGGVILSHTCVSHMQSPENDRMLSDDLSKEKWERRALDLFPWAVRHRVRMPIEISNAKSCRRHSGPGISWQGPKLKIGVRRFRRLLMRWAGGEWWVRLVLIMSISGVKSQPTAIPTFVLFVHQPISPGLEVRQGGGNLPT